jgi:hypothetical protein
MEQIVDNKQEIDISNNKYKSKSNLQLLRLTVELQEKHEKMKEVILKKVEELEAIENDYKQIIDVLLYRKQ